jgi:hypothetical protein
MSPIVRTAAARRVLAGTAAVFAVLRLLGCVPIKEEDDSILIPPPIPTPTASPAPVAALPDFTISDMRQEPGSDPSLVRIFGTVVNHGNVEASHVVVRVEGRDVLGRALTRVNVPTLVEPIAPGGSSTFEASMPKSTAIHDYDAEVIAK